VLEKVGSQLLVVFLYTNSCGACKAAHKRLEALCSEVRLACINGRIAFFKAFAAARGKTLAIMGGGPICTKQNAAS
jgi:Zn-dependent alcohol dehydrogenase